MVARFDDTRDDRRLENRVRLSAEVALESADRRFGGMSCDISRGGVFVATETMVPVGSDVRLTIALPSGALSLEGTIRWRRDVDSNDDAEPGLGIAFTRLQPAQLALLGLVCDEREPYFYEFDR